MSAFAAANDALFADANMAGDITYLRQGLGPATTVRGIISAPDETTAFSDTVLQSGTLILSVRIADMTEAADGDRFLINGADHVVMGVPRRDIHNLMWRIVLVPEELE